MVTFVVFDHPIVPSYLSCTHTLIIIFSLAILLMIFPILLTGKEVSLFVKEYYQQQLLRLDSFKKGDIERALVESFHGIDVMLNNIVSSF